MHSSNSRSNSSCLLKEVALHQQLLSLAYRNIWSARCSLFSFINQWSVSFHFLHVAERAGVPYLYRWNLILVIGPLGFVWPEAGHVSHLTTFSPSYPLEGKTFIHFQGLNLIWFMLECLTVSSHFLLGKKGRNYPNGNSNYLPNISESRSLECKSGILFWSLDPENFAL